jgi:hypothetical protein
MGGQKKQQQKTNNVVTTIVTPQKSKINNYGLTQKVTTVSVSFLIAPIQTSAIHGKKLNKAAP